MNSSKIRIGTRGSKLAMWQATHVASLLEKGGVESEIIPIDTLGDKILDVTISKIGSKGVFTEEIEEQLKLGNIDIAVHSAKDMPSQLPDGFSLIAFTERETVNDVLVSVKKGISLNDNPLVVGTSSTRRVATLKRLYPHVKAVAIRGNLQTRLAKMEAGQCDALLLAYAGVFRMGYAPLIVAQLPLEQFTPAVGQGSIAVEVAGSLSADKKALIRQCVNHEPTEWRLLAERAFLKTLQGGCSIPVFALAYLEDKTLRIHGGIISLNGEEIVEESITGTYDEAEQLGYRLGRNILERGGEEMLREIKETLKN